MNDGFLARWSRLKRAERTAPEPLADPPAAESPVPLDPESLPSPESIGPDSDVTVFLQPGVPPELKARALRRAWVEDPRIRDFLGLNDYDEDFNRPDLLNRIVNTVYRVGSGMPDLPPREPEPVPADTTVIPDLSPAEQAALPAPDPEPSDLTPPGGGQTVPVVARVRRGGATPV